MIICENVVFLGYLKQIGMHRGRRVNENKPISSKSQKSIIYAEIFEKRLNFFIFYYKCIILTVLLLFFF